MDDPTPATKGDLARLEQSLRSDMSIGFQRVDEQFQKVDEQFQKIDERFQSVNTQFQSIDTQFQKAREDSDRILDVLINVDKRLGGKVDDHERRITALEGAMAA